MIENHSGEWADSGARRIDDRCAIHVMEDQNLLNLDRRQKLKLQVEFSNLSYSIRRRKQNSKNILNNISGYFRPGRVTAIIGPSGAGKSTLLGIISALKTNNVTGMITINGTKWHKDDFRKLSCFVPQEFALIPLLTTRETLYIAARLKLDRRFGLKSFDLIVNEAADDLGLTKCLDTLVGNLSSGERKRLSIGIEIITHPSILLLDEPTSGLDSASSNQVIGLLSKMAKGGCTVACAVHQPSSRMISQLDDLLILHQGRSFYCGPWDELLNTFGSAGYACPQFYNVAEFVLEVVTEERGGNLENLYEINQQKCQKWRKQHQYHLESDGTNSIDPAVDKFERQSGKLMNDSLSLSSWEQQKILFLRALICIKRDYTMTNLRFATHVMIAVLLGVMFYDVGNNASKTSSNIACMFFILMFLYYATAMPSVQIFPIEAAVFLREYSNNWYRLRSYYIVKVLSDLPLQILLPTIFILITYYMTGQPMEYHRLLRAWIISVLMTIIGQSSGILVGLAFGAEMGIFLIPTTSLVMVIFAGFFLKYNEMAFYLQPVGAMSFFRYSFEGIMQAIYDSDREKLACSEVYCYLRSPRKILELFNMPAISFCTAIYMLSLWIVILQLFIYFALKWKAYSARK